MREHASRAPRCATRLNREVEAGIASSLEASIQFYRWAESQGDRLTAQAIRDRYDCSRATSYRWFNAFRAAQRRVQA